MTDKMKPCPFCGSTAKKLAEGYVSCDNHDCPMSAMSMTVDAWNNRANDAKGDEVVTCASCQYLDGKSLINWNNCRAREMIVRDTDTACPQYNTKLATVKPVENNGPPETWSCRNCLGRYDTTKCKLVLKDGACVNFSDRAVKPARVKEIALTENAQWYSEKQIVKEINALKDAINEMRKR